MDGIINILKPPGMTSHDVVVFLRRLAGGKKTGHTGTLDPGAAGVLPICMGRATRIIQFLPDDKEYRTEITFGLATSTGDAFGEILYRGEAKQLTVDLVKEVLEGFRGEIFQVPPMTSAIRHQGKKLYQLARQGLEVQRQPRRVNIYSLRLIRMDRLGTPHPRALVDVVCSAGTYIRTLCIDLGERLGCGAYMSFLLRTRAGLFSISRAFTLEEADQLARQGNLERNLVTLDEALGHLPAVQVRQGAVAAVRSGNTLYWPGVVRVAGTVEAGQMVRLQVGPVLLAVARVEPDLRRPGCYQFHPVRVLT